MDNKHHEIAMSWIPETIWKNVISHIVFGLITVAGIGLAVYPQIQKMQRDIDNLTNQYESSKQDSKYIIAILESIKSIQENQVELKADITKRIDGIDTKVDNVNWDLQRFKDGVYHRVPNN